MVEFFVSPFGGRVFDYFFPAERGFGGMILDIPFYQWGYASILALGFVLGIAFGRWRALKRSTPTTADADQLKLELFVSRSIFPAIDRLDGFIDESTATAMVNGDISGVLLRYYLASAMTRYRDEAQRTLERKASGKPVNVTLLERSLCETLEAYRTTSSATHNAIEPPNQLTISGNLYRRWKQADDEVDRSLNELIGALPDNSVLRARLRLIRSRFSHLA